MEYRDLEREESLVTRPIHQIKGVKQLDRVDKGKGGCPALFSFLHQSSYLFDFFGVYSSVGRALGFQHKSGVAGSSPLIPKPIATWA